MNRLFLVQLFFLFCCTFDALGMDDLNVGMDDLNVGMEFFETPRNIPQSKKSPLHKPNSQIKIFSEDIKNKKRDSGFDCFEIKADNYVNFLHLLYSSTLNNEKPFIITNSMAIEVAYDIISGNKLPVTANHQWTKPNIDQIDFKRFPKQLDSLPSSDGVKKNLEFELYYLNTMLRCDDKVLSAAADLISAISQSLHRPRLKNDDGNVGEKADTLLRQIKELDKNDLPWQMRYRKFGKIHYCFIIYYNLLKSWIKTLRQTVTNYFSSVTKNRNDKKNDSPPKKKIPETKNKPDRKSSSRKSLSDDILQNNSSTSRDSDDEYESLLSYTVDVSEVKNKGSNTTDNKDDDSSLVESE